MKRVGGDREAVVFRGWDAFYNCATRGRAV